MSYNNFDVFSASFPLFGHTLVYTHIARLRWRVLFLFRFFPNRAVQRSVSLWFLIEPHSHFTYTHASVVCPENQMPDKTKVWRESLPTVFIDLQSPLVWFMGWPSCRFYFLGEFRSADTDVCVQTVELELFVRNRIVYTCRGDASDKSLFLLRTQMFF